MTTGTPTAPADDLDADALQVAMKAHPVVVDAIERVSRRAKTAEADRDTAIKERDAARRDQKNAQAQLDVTKGVLNGYMKAFDTPSASTTTETPAPSDAEVMAKFEAMTPAEQALILTKGAAIRRFDMRGDGPALGERMFAK